MRCPSSSSKQRKKGRKSLLCLWVLSPPSRDWTVFIHIGRGIYSAESTNSNANFIQKHPQTHPDPCLTQCLAPLCPGKLTSLALTAVPATRPGSGTFPPPPGPLPALLPRLSLSSLPNCIRIPAGNQRMPTWGSVGESLLKSQQTWVSPSLRTGTGEAQGSGLAMS